MKDRTRRTPQQKKADEYDRDHYMHNDFGFWRKWSQLKAHEHRVVRRKSSCFERAISQTAGGPEELESIERRDGYRPRKLQKGRPPSVRERVQTKLDIRVWGMGWNRFFGRRFQPDLHREPFRRFLFTMMKGRTGNAVRLAEWYRLVLSGSPSNLSHTGPSRTAANWLRKFFAVDPDMEVLFRDWIEKMAP